MRTLFCALFAAGYLQAAAGGETPFWRLMLYFCLALAFGLWAEWRESK